MTPEELKALDEVSEKCAEFIQDICGIARKYDVYKERILLSVASTIDIFIDAIAISIKSIEEETENE